MTKTDTRTLSQTTQDELRFKGVSQVKSGVSQVAVARALGVRTGTVSAWMKRDREAKGQRMMSGRRGPKSSPRLALKPWQQAVIAKQVIHSEPNQLRLPFALWTRQGVADLIHRKFGIRLSRWCVGSYLKRWGFTPQVPAKRARLRDQQRIASWTQTEYPKLKNEAKQTKSSIWFMDETGMRSDDQVGRTYGKRGKTPVITVSGQRFSCNVISAITPRGELAFSVFEGTMRSARFIRFLDRLCTLAKRKVILVLDGHPVHKSRAVATWVEANAKRIKLAFLPPYSPELNPDELLNNDLKQNTIRRAPPENKSDLKRMTRNHLAKRQRQPDLVRNFFKESHVSYAA